MIEFIDVPPVRLRYSCPAKALDKNFMTEPIDPLHHPMREIVRFDDDGLQVKDHSV
jgi:hypothetical protein